MESIKKCPVCLNAHGADIQQIYNWDDVYCLECIVCGRYKLTLEGYSDELKSTSRHFHDWTDVRRAALSHALITQRELPLGEEGLPYLKSKVLEEFRQSGRTLPTKRQQANNIIQYVGNYEHGHGHKLKYPEASFHAVVGSLNRDLACRLGCELKERRLIYLTDTSDQDGYDFMDVSLTLDGWERWEDERSDKNTSNVGLVAMKFGDPDLDALVEGIVKPAVAEIHGLSVARIDDKPKAGVIDVILRQTIRDCAFVIADLSHANNGAYWEAGFAEGLGKPVIYICERSVWDENKTHFDTNHCTTIIYEKGEEEKFKMQLIATLRNSLNLFG